MSLVSSLQSEISYINYYCSFYILGIALDVIDYFVAEIPYMIFIPLQIVAIVMIFGGFIGRKREKTQKQKATGR